MVRNAVGPTLEALCVLGPLSVMFVNDAPPGTGSPVDGALTSEEP